MIYSERTKRSAVFVDKAGCAEPVERVPLMAKSFDEDWLQNLIADNPCLLQSEEICADYQNLVCVGTEVGVGQSGQMGYIDVLLVSSDGKVVVVETKLFRNAQAKRTVVAQVIDYAQKLQSWNAEKLDSVARFYSKKKYGQEQSVFELVKNSGFLGDADEARFTDALNRSLQSAEFLLLIVGDGIRSEAEQLVGFLNSYTSMQFRIALLELEVYNRPDGVLVIPNVLEKTSVIEKEMAFSDYYSEPSKPSPQKYYSEAVLSKRDFILEFSSAAGLDAGDVSDFISNIEQIQNVTSTIHHTELRIRVKTRAGGIPILIFYRGKHGKNPADAYIIPRDIFTMYAQMGFDSRAEADDYLNFFKDYLDLAHCYNEPYINENACYYLDLQKMLSGADKIVGAIEQFAKREFERERSETRG